MLHEADFADAHRRHWEDAELIYRHELGRMPTNCMDSARNMD